jgi:hypothetical protein
LPAAWQRGNWLGRAGQIGRPTVCSFRSESAVDRLEDQSAAGGFSRLAGALVGRRLDLPIAIPTMRTIARISA